MSENLQTKKAVNRRLILLAGCVVNFCQSGTSAFSVFVKPVMDATEWPMGSITLAYTLFNIVLCITGIVVGTFSHKCKPWQIIYPGAVLYALGWILTGTAGSVLAMQLSFGVVGGIGCGFLYNYTVTNVIKWFPDRKGFASGLLLGCSAIGPVFCSPMATTIISKLGVFAAFSIMGTIYGVLLLVFGWLVRPPFANAQSATPVAIGSENDLNWKQMLRTSTFYMLYIVFVCACTSYMMMLNAASVIGQEQAGMSVAMATLSVTLLAICNFGGRMLFGTVSDKFGRYQTLLAVMAINFVAMIAMSMVTAAVPFLVLMCVVGACGGALLVMFPPIVSERFGVKHSSLNYSIMFSAYSVASFVGPQIAAHYREQGNYGPAFIRAAVLTVVAAALLFVVIRQAKKA